MNFLTPLALLFGLLAAPIILMYMLRLRRQEVVVSSTLLWQKLIRDREANATVAKAATEPIADFAADYFEPVGFGFGPAVYSGAECV